MSRKVQQLLAKQNQAKVVEKSHPAISGDVQFVALATLATFFAGVFYFFSFSFYYYFWGSLRDALIGF